MYGSSLIPGQILAVIGPNGAGKTTVFNVVTGIYSATEGQILFQGKSILTGANLIRLPGLASNAPFSRAGFSIHSVSWTTF